MCIHFKLSFHFAYTTVGGWVLWPKTFFSCCKVMQRRMCSSRRRQNLPPKKLPPIFHIKKTHQIFLQKRHCFNFQDLTVTGASFFIIEGGGRQRGRKTLANFTPPPPPTSFPYMRRGKNNWVVRKNELERGGGRRGGEGQCSRHVVVYLVYATGSF